MKKSVRLKDEQVARPPRAKLTPEEIKKRMLDFPKRKEEYLAASRKNKN